MYDILIDLGSQMDVEKWVTSSTVGTDICNTVTVRDLHA